MGKQGNESRVLYKDVGLFLVLIPCINALNYYLTYTSIGLNWHTGLTFTIDTLQGYAAWLAARAVIFRLDRLVPYDAQPLKRILLQILVSSAEGLAVIVGITEILTWAVMHRPMPSSFYRFDVFIYLIWFLVVNGIYIGLYYYHRFKEAERQRLEDKKLRQLGFSGRSGKQNLQVDYAETSGIYVEGDYAMLVTTHGKKHLLDLSLDKVEKLLPWELFFRVNRQYILHQNLIRGFERSENGKINVLIRTGDHFPESIPVSRTKAPAFKSWFREKET